MFFLLLKKRYEIRGLITDATYFFFLRGKARPNPSPIFLLGDLQTGNRWTRGGRGFFMQLLIMLTTFPPPWQKLTELSQLISSWAITMHPGITFFQNFQKSLKYCQISQNISKVLKTFPNFSKNLQISHSFSQFFRFFLQIFLNFSNIF